MKMGEGKKYYCMIRVSGCADITYEAYKLKELGLRPFELKNFGGEIMVESITSQFTQSFVSLYSSN